MKNPGKIAAILGTAVVLVCSMFGGAGAATQCAWAAQNTEAETTAKGSQTADGFSVKTQVGLEGHYKMGAPTPVTVSLESPSDFEGVLRIIVPQDDGYGSTASVGYETNVMLTAGVQKQISMSLNGVLYGQNLTLELEDTDGKLVMTTPITLRAESETDILVGVLSDDFSAVSYFDGRYLDGMDLYGSTMVVELTADDFPETESSLEALGYLVINSFDTSELSGEQMQALQDWVNNGGVLVVGCGSDYRQTLSGFSSDFFTGSVSGMLSGELALENDSTATVSFTDQDGIADIELQDGRCMEGVLTQQGLIWEKDCRLGRVVVCGFNLGMEPVTGWAGKEEMAQNLLLTAADGYPAERMSNLNYSNQDYNYSSSRALDQMHDVEMPNTTALFILLIVFAVFSGPGLYLILKKPDKREYLWVIVPAVSVLLTSGVFLFTSNLRIKNVQFSSITVVSSDGESDTADRSVYLALQVPEAGTSQVQLKNNIGNISLATPDTGVYINLLTYSSDNDYDLAIRESSEGYGLTINTKSTFESTYLRADYKGTENQSRGLELHAVRSLTGISGTVTNTSGQDLDDCVIYSSKGYVYLGELAAGETRSFTEEDNISTSGEGYYLVSQDITADDDAESYWFANAWEMIGETYLDYMASSEVYAFACDKEADLDFVADDKVQEKNAVIYLDHQTTALEEFPDAQMWPLYEYSYNVDQGDFDSDGWLMSDEAIVTFDLSGYVQNIDAITKAQPYDNYWADTTEYVTVEAYNWETDTYEDIFGDAYIARFPEGCPYLNAEGKMRFRFTSPRVSSQGQDYAPEITVIGGGK